MVAAHVQHAHPADRFAREIAAILECDTMRSRRLMRNSLARPINAEPLSSPFVWYNFAEKGRWLRVQNE